MQEAQILQLQSTVVWAMFAVSFVLGLAMSRSNFCTMGAVADIVNMNDWTRMRMWLFAIGVAMIGTALMSASGLIDITKSIYLTPKLTWLSSLIGGLLFGFGMVLASGCGSKTLVRIGAGSLKSLVVFIVMGLFAYMSLRGIFAVLRVASIDQITINFAQGQDLPRLFADSKAAAGSLRLWLGVGLGAALVLFSLMGKEFRNSETIVGALLVGLAVVAGWYVSGKIGYVPEDPKTLEEAFLATNSGRLESFSFVAPAAYTLELLMFWSDKTRIVTLGIAATLGMIIGSFVYALISKTFQWEGFANAEDTANHLVGAALMGIGGVTALGCTVGQGLTGISTLALGSFIAFAGILVGAVLGLKYQMWRV
jgi:uncharacterized protein